MPAATANDAPIAASIPITTQPGASPHASMSSLITSRKLPAVFDEAFDLYKRHFARIALITSIMLLPALALCQALGTYWLKPRYMLLNTGHFANSTIGFEVIVGFLIAGLPRYGLPGLISLTALLVASGPVSIAASAAIFGNPLTIPQAFRAGIRRLFALIALAATVSSALIGAGSIVALVLLLILVAASALLPHMPDSLGILIGILVLASPVVAGCAVAGRWFLFAVPLIVIEHQPISRIVARNDDLSFGLRFRKRWAIALFLPVALIAVQALVTSALTSIVSLLPMGPGLQFVGHTLAVTGTTVLFQPYWMVFLTYIYWSQRMRAEAADMVNDTLSDPGSALTLATAAPVPPPLPVTAGLRTVPPTIPPIPVIPQNGAMRGDPVNPAEERE